MGAIYWQYVKEVLKSTFSTYDISSEFIRIVKITGKSKDSAIS